MNEFSHTDEQGKARMVDIGSKDIQHRIAKAEGYITLQPETLRLIRENQVKKGDVLSTAQLAGIYAAKQTGLMIPLCHNIALEKVSVDLDIEDDGVRARSEVSCTGKTGVEMEALTAVSMSLLTVYDMCKAVDKSMVISKISLTEKIKE